MNAVATGAISSESLADALGTEARLLAEMGSILRSQRDGVAAEDLDRVNDSIQAVHRMLLTLSEARLRRRTIVRGLTGADEVPVDNLEDALGPAATENVVEARDRLRAVAAELERDLSLNRRILAAAVATGDAHLRALSGTPAQPLTYEAGPQPDARPPVGRSLINQKV